MSTAPGPSQVFISYRRDDAAGYAGRLEEALETRLGRGAVFRDLQDLQPGEDFVQAIQQRLSTARVVLVLIGPRWAGGELPVQRRIDQPTDLVRHEVAAALAGSARVVPVLLPGGRMPAESELPPDLQDLARRNAMGLSDAHWHADIARLAALVAEGLPAAAAPAPTPPAGGGRRRVGWVIGLATLLVAGVAGALAWTQPWRPPPDPGAAFLGLWQGPVRYAWGDRREERFEIKRHAGELTGTASFLGVARGMEQVVLQGSFLRFETRTQQSMNGETRTMTHRYSAELRGEPGLQRLALRMHSVGGFENNPPLEFEAQRVQPAAGAASAAAAR